ncbi:MAG: hypothetical protein Q7S27_06395 [Nanoarchaeota archaeon]|nr:hypothetical protein [Nanoarchaeota archaeon]
MKKRGDFNLSFSMIFSIIVIIAIVAVAFYVIKSFVSVSECTQIGLFYEDIQEHISKAWQSPISKDTFIGKIPSGINLVCFGNLNQSSSKEYREEHNSILKANINMKNRNLFLYPANKACDSTLSSIKLDHVKTDEFFCIPAKDSKIELITEKDQFDSLVTLRK